MIKVVFNVFASLLTFTFGVIVTVLTINPQLSPLDLPESDASYYLNSIMTNESDSQKVRTGDEPLNLRRIVVSNCGLRSKAIYKPMPKYPDAAKGSYISGSVIVQIMIDEAGEVIEAQALTGDQTLQRAAVEAARQTLFEPVSLGGHRIKVTGVIKYNFVLD